MLEKFFHHLTRFVMAVYIAEAAFCIGVSLWDCFR
jgi:hypothetical protein